MNKLSAIPVLMIRNESRWIRHVLRPLLATFPEIIVADTGSTDDTLDIVQECCSLDQLRLYEFGEQTGKGLTAVRQKLTGYARDLGYKTNFLVDGDEIYTIATLKSIVSQLELPDGKFFGFSAMVAIGKDELGNYWELDEYFRRNALYLNDTVWKREYPRELPSRWGLGKGAWHFWDLPEGYAYHAIHVHNCIRSPKDNQVYMRPERKDVFREERRPDIKRIKPFNMEAWLNS